MLSASVTKNFLLSVLYTLNTQTRLFKGTSREIPSGCARDGNGEILAMGSNHLFLGRYVGAHGPPVHRHGWTEVVLHQQLGRAFRRLVQLA